MHLSYLSVNFPTPKYEKKLMTPTAEVIRLILNAASDSDQPNSSIAIGVPRLKEKVMQIL